jgi:hypothetical protein
MKMRYVLLIFGFAFSSALLTPKIAYGQNQCAQIFTAESYTSRSEMAQRLKENKIPSVMMKTYSQDIPVVLLNARTAPALNDLINQSIGTMVAHQPGYKNDHGLLRLKYTIADMDSPGSRRRGELHKTGISWVDLKAYLGMVSKYKRIEVTYALTPSETRTAEIYARMRRAAIVRARFAFGEFKQVDTPPNLMDSGENCFGFCSAGGLYQEIREIKTRFQNTGVGSFDELMAKPDVQIWLDQVGQSLMNADVNSAEGLSPQIPTWMIAPESVAKNPVFQAMSQEQKSETLNWLAGGKISMDYAQLTQDLGFSATGNGFAAMHNARATAVLVYDSTTSDTDFVSPAYTSPGIFSTWNHSNTQPIQ